MAKVDDLLQRWTKQIVLTIVARTAHGFSPTANLAVKGITKPPNPEFKNARKPGPTHGFLAKSNTSRVKSLRQINRFRILHGRPTRWSPRTRRVHATA